MLKFRREKDKQFKHITRGLIPAASLAPKPAVPRTPPPRSPNPSPERPRSALAAVVLSSSLTGQTWAIPPARPWSFSGGGQSESFVSEPNISTALFTRDRWSEDLANQPRLSSPDHSEEELGEEEEVENEEESEEHVYQSLDREDNCSVTGPIYALPLKSKSGAPQPNQMSGGRASSTDFTEKTSVQSPEASCESANKKAPVRRRPGSPREVVPIGSMPPTLTADHPNCSRKAKTPTQLSPEPSKTYSEVQREGVCDLPEENTRLVNGQKLLEERAQQLEQEISHSQTSSNLKPSAGSQAEIWNLRQHTQELVDENDAFKLTVHRLNVELSRYQTCFRPLPKQENSKIQGLPNTGSPPPWLLDMKYLCPLLLAYEDRINEKDSLLQTTEEEVKRLRVHIEDVIKENERLHDEIAKFGGISQTDCHQLQQQAILVLQENQVLIDQLETQHVKAKARLNRHRSEVSKVSKQLKLLEAEKQCLQEDLEKSRGEAQKHLSAVHALQARLKDAITWDEHCSIVKQLEQQSDRNRSEMDDLVLRMSSLQKENRCLALDKANLTADMKKLEADLELKRQASRKTERKMSVMERQKQECLLTEEKTRHYMGAVVSVAEQVSKERDQLIHRASVLQQEKQDFLNRIVNGTFQLEKLQEEVKVYRRQASNRLAVLEQEAEGRTASYQREILHLQGLLKERQTAEERLLQSKREVEEELEIVWQAATRENQQMRDTLFDSNFSSKPGRYALSGSASTGLPTQAPDECGPSTHTLLHFSGPHHLSPHQSPGLQTNDIFQSDLDQQNNTLDEKHKHGLDFYC